MNTSVILLALGSALFFGLALVLTQNGLCFIGPLQGSCVSISTAAAIFVVVAPVTVGFSYWSVQSAGLFALIGCLFPATVTILTFFANRGIGPNMTGALGNLAPVFAVVFAILFLGEAPSPERMAAIAVIVIGVVMLFRAPLSGRAGIARWAIWLPVAAALIRGAMQPIVKFGLAGWPNPFAAVTIGYLVSTGVVLAASAVRERGRPVVFDRHGWGWFSAVGVCNGLAVLCMFQALALGPVTLVAPLVACYPLATVAFGRALFGTASLNRRTAIGVGITVAGVVLLLVV